jgi:thioredoxin-related protein
MGGKSSFRLNEPVTFTPTFVWVDNGVEVGRFSGYFGKEQFFSIVNKAAANAHRNGARHKTSALN